MACNIYSDEEPCLVVMPNTALIMMFNCRPFLQTFGHYFALFALHAFAGCSMETTVNRMEKYIDDQIENFVQQILTKY